MNEIWEFVVQNPVWIIVAAVLLLLLIFFTNYRKVPPNIALVISGCVRRRYKVKDEDGKTVVKKFGYRIVRGGATVVIPFLERVDKLNLGIMQVDIRTTQPVPSQEYISVMVDGVANIKIGSDDVSIATAAEQFLNWKQENIAAIAQQVLEGNMREIIGRMTIADLVQNRDKFATETSRAAAADMANMGLEIINITIQNFSDKDGVVETMATKNIVEKERDAQIAKAEAEQQGHKAKVEADALMAEQTKDLELKQAEYKIQADRAQADADVAYKIQQEVARKSFEEERAQAEMIRLQKQTELERQQVEIQRQKLNVEIREKAEADRDARIAQAEAEKAEKQALADAAYYAAQKEAEAILLKGKAEAEALQLKAEAMQLYGQAAMLEMVVEKLPDVAKAIGEPLAQTEKILMFGEGAATGLARDVTGSMMQTFEAMKSSVGIDIPKMLKDVTTGGLIGRAAEKEAEESAPEA
ncbi:MAG: hypothetical protein E7329_05530 [Clostridiales bacterium]|nr:hypothetical protein [Clostridiales bacterium]